MLKLPAIFSDHMILQRNRVVYVWGESDATKVTVSIQDVKIPVDVIDGKWMAALSPIEGGGPYEMEITSDLDDRIVFEDVVYGEVWLAGGQSNMELELQNSKDGADAV